MVSLLATGKKREPSTALGENRKNAQGRFHAWAQHLPVERSFRFHTGLIVSVFSSLSRFILPGAGLFNNRTFVEQLLAVALVRYALDAVDVALHAVTAASSSVAMTVYQTIEKPCAGDTCNQFCTCQNGQMGL